VNQHRAENIESNTSTVIGSALSSSPVIAGSNAQVSVSVGATQENQELTIAIAQLRKALDEVRAQGDRRDDETRERLDLAESRLTGIEDELQNPKRGISWARIKKLMTGIGDALNGMTGLTTSVDSLWQAVEKVTQ
jgi:hypothetical protein